MTIAAAVLAAAAAGAAAADPGGGTRSFWSALSLSARGGLAAGAPRFELSRPFTEYLEEGRLDSIYTRSLGSDLELGIEYAVSRHIAVSASYGWAHPAASGRWSATFPHPLYLERPRHANGTLDGLRYREDALHVDLVLQSARGRLRYGVFAGAARLQVKTHLIDTPQYRQEYPFDTVSVFLVPRSFWIGSATSVSGGAALDYGVTRRLGLSARLRFSRARPELHRTGVDERPQLDAGGLRAGLGLTLRLGPVRKGRPGGIDSEASGRDARR
jgi:hypothetical protein